MADVQAKMSNLPNLRSEVNASDRLQNNANVECSKTRARYDNEKHRFGLTRAQQKFQSLLSELGVARVATENRHARAVNALRDGLKPPPRVIQPLLKNERLALRCIFFFGMPAEFRLLARLSFMAQQAWLLRPDDPAASTPRVALGNPWHTHYSHRSRDGPSLPNAGGPLSFCMGAGDAVPPPETIGPGNVEQCCEESNGVWHPDGFNMCVLSPSFASVVSGKSISLSTKFHSVPGPCACRI